MSGVNFPKKFNLEKMMNLVSDDGNTVSIQKGLFGRKTVTVRKGDDVTKFSYNKFQRHLNNTRINLEFDDTKLQDALKNASSTKAKTKFDKVKTSASEKVSGLFNQVHAKLERTGQVFMKKPPIQTAPPDYSALKLRIDKLNDDIRDANGKLSPVQGEGLSITRILDARNQTKLEKYQKIMNDSFDRCKNESLSVKAREKAKLAAEKAMGNIEKMLTAINKKYPDED